VSTADNRKLAEELFARLSAGDVPGALATMTDDATWLAAGRRELLPAAGNYNKEKLGRFFNPMLGQLKNGLKMTMKGMIAEGDRVALEAESYGELKNGRIYKVAQALWGLEAEGIPFGFFARRLRPRESLVSAGYGLRRSAGHTITASTSAGSHSSLARMVCCRLVLESGFHNWQPKRKSRPEAALWCGRSLTAA
jgi:uncharacterized protein